MKKRITFIRNGKYWPCDFAQHASIIIEDMEAKKSYHVSYLPENCNKMSVSLVPVLHDEERLKETCDRDIAVLYCNDDSKTIDAFKKLYDEKFTQNRFNLLTNNCSDAAQFTMEYFFPRAHEINEFHCVKDSLSCLFYTVTMASKWFTPSCISAPDRMFNRVKSLEKYYGEMKEVEVVSGLEKKGEADERGISLNYHF